MGSEDREFIEATLDLPIRYIDRSREYYLALGFDNPYRWARFDDVPFTPLDLPLSEARVALVTTAAPLNPAAGDQGPWAPYNAAAKFTEVYTAAIDPEPDVRISHLGYDRKHTSAEDRNSYFPLARLKEAAAAGRIGHLNERFIGLPTLRSQRITLEQHAPAVLERCRADGVQAAVVVPT